MGFSPSLPRTLCVLLPLLAAVPAGAQDAEAEWRLFNDILNTINSVSEETARDAQAACLEHGKRLAGMANVSPLQRVSLEAEVENCLSYAMHRGNFSDDTGDQCSHHLAYVSKLAEATGLAVGDSRMTNDAWSMVSERLERQISIAPDMGCTADYSGFLPALSVAKEQAAKSPPPEPFPLVREVEGMKYAVTANNAREMKASCEAVLQKAASVQGMSEAERAFSEAKAEDCIAATMVHGEFSDASGNVCDHHFRFAQKLSASIAAAPGDPAFAERILPYALGELETAKRQGPGMGCTQDYAGLEPK
jgi:hypothetical protein